MRGIRKLGFTMIELLVVIAVIGILAVALLATLNPLEQIRKGRDTRTRSDAAQLASALERYNASLGRFPWQATEGEDVTVPFTDIKTGDAGVDCSLAVCTLIAGDGTGVLEQLTATNEVKSGFIDRIAAANARDLYIAYNNADTGASVTVCFMPESNTFAQEAYDRCVENSFGTDFEAAYGSYGAQTSSDAQFACPDSATPTDYTAGGFDSTDADELICIP